jgi:hypothetical protein
MAGRLESYCIILLLLAGFLIVCGCLGASSNTLPSTKYVALEAELRDDGTITSGWSPQGDAVPPGIFFYNKDLVHSVYGDSLDHAPGYPPANESMKILLGQYYTESRAWNQKGNLTVMGVYGYPYAFENGPTILNIDRNGTVRMTYDNESIDLKTGDSWKTPVISTRSENYSGSYIEGDINGTSRDVYYSYTVEWVTTWTIRNLGAYDK